MTKPTTKDQIIDSAIEEFAELCKRNGVHRDRFEMSFKPWLRTKLEEILFSRGEVEKLLYSLKYENTDKIVYEKRIYSDENLVNKIAKAITAQQMRGIK
jgi:hypothetical protein